MKTVIHYNTNYQVQPFVYTSLKGFCTGPHEYLFEKIKRRDLMNDPYTDKWGNTITRVPVNVSMDEINAVKFFRLHGTIVSGKFDEEKSTIVFSNKGDRYTVDIDVELKEGEFYNYEIDQLKDKLGTRVNYLGELGKLITRKINNYVGI